MADYLENLKRQVEERRLRREAAAAEHRAAKDAKAARPSSAERMAKLRAAVERWYAALAPEDRRPRYLISHLAPLFRCTPQMLGGVLPELGWRRKRSWRDDAPTHRYWLPPDSEEFAKQRPKPPDQS
jgi:hypothetical protein